MQWNRNRLAIFAGILATILGIGGTLWARQQPAPVKPPPVVESDAPGLVSGRVVYADGKAASGFKIEALITPFSTGPSGGSAVTDERGYYEIRNLTNEGFVISVYNEGKPFIARIPQRKVLLSPGDNKRDQVNFVLEAGPEITVRVRDAETNAPVAGMPVRANGEGGSPQPVGVTDANGEYILHSPVRDVEIELNIGFKYETVIQNVDAAPGYGFRYAQTLPATAKVVWNVKTYADRYTSSPVRTLRGTVVDAERKPVYGATVRLMYGNSSSPIVGQTRTNLAGQFAIESPRFDSEGVIFVRERDKPDSETIAHIVQPSDTWQPLVLHTATAQNATVTGVTVDTSGKPVGGVPVQYSSSFLSKGNPYSNRYVGGFVNNPAVVISDGTGRFTLSGIFPDTETRFTFGGKEWGNSRYPYLPFEYARITLEANEKRDIGKIVMHHADRRVTGRLVDEAGEPVSRNVDVHIIGEHTNASADLQKDGSFVVKNVVDEPLSLLIVYGTGSGSGYTIDKMKFPYIRPVKAGDDLRIVAPPRNVKEDKPPATP